MVWADPTTVLGELAIGVIGGLVSTGVYLAYLRWITDYARWPYAVTHQEVPDPAIPGNFTAKVSIRNRTTTSTQFLINLRLETGDLHPPRACCADEADRRHVEGWGTIAPGDTRAFEFQPAAYPNAVAGVTLVAKAPYQREIRQFSYDFPQSFPPLSESSLEACSA
jgi:hypothetical protein